MKLKYVLLISLSCALTGTIFFMIQRNWLVIQFGFTPSSSLTLSPEIKQIHQKKTKLFYKKNDKWLTEEVSIIWDEHNSAQNIKLLIKQWLVLMQDEHLLPAHIALESVACSSQGTEGYISFDQSLFSKEWPLNKKWLILESLFKTIHHAGTQLNTLMLLVHHQVMNDDHLDLSQPLPLITPTLL